MWPVRMELEPVRFLPPLDTSVTLSRFTRSVLYTLHIGGLEHQSISNTDFFSGNRENHNPYLLPPTVLDWCVWTDRKTASPDNPGALARSAPNQDDKRQGTLPARATLSTNGTAGRKPPLPGWTCPHPKYTPVAIRVLALIRPFVWHWEDSSRKRTWCAMCSGNLLSQGLG